jgi:nitrate reductase NapAB chaperone NapD
VPIKSYLAYPEPGRREELAARLGAIEGCEVSPSTTHDVLIVVTDTETDQQEKELEDRLGQEEGLLCLALVSGAEPDLIQIDLEKNA